MKLEKVRAAVEHFFLYPARARPLAAVRIGLSLVLLWQAFLLRHSLVDLFGSDGIIQGELADILNSPNGPRISWIAWLLSPLGFTEIMSLNFAGALYATSLVFLLFGLHTRAAAFLAWLLHWIFMATGETNSYGVDLYAHVFLFYLIFVPAGNTLSLDVLSGRKKDDFSPGARLGLRVMQLQLCITYFMSAKDKAEGIQWWDGELMWRALTMPLYAQFEMHWTAQYPLLLMFLGWMSMALEAGYCIFIWPKRTRWLWILGMTGLHTGIAVFMGLHLFGLIMCMLTVTTFGVSPESEPAFVGLRGLGRRIRRPVEGVPTAEGVPAAEANPPGNSA